jgi:hypothetical protein
VDRKVGVGRESYRGSGQEKSKLFPFGITATTNGSCETTNLELKPVVVSEIPNAKEELKAYLRLTGLVSE